MTDAHAGKRSTLETMEDAFVTETLAQHLSELPSLSVIAQQWLRTRPPHRVLASAINEYVERLTQSTTKGQLGEQYVLDLLAKEYAVRKVAHAARSCDLWLEEHNVLVEVKTYKRAVPQTEVDKCMRDVAERKPNAAVLLSLTSGVAHVGNMPCIALEWHRGTPVWVCASDDESLLLSVVRAACQMAQRVRVQRVTEFQPGAASDVPAWAARASAHVTRMQVMVHEMADARQALETTSDHMHRMMQHSIVAVRCVEQRLLDEMRVFTA